MIPAAIVGVTVILLFVPASSVSGAKAWLIFCHEENIFNLGISHSALHVFCTRSRQIHQAKATAPRTQAGGARSQNNSKSKSFTLHSPFLCRGVPAAQAVQVSMKAFGPASCIETLTLPSTLPQSRWSRLSSCTGSYQYRGNIARLNYFVDLRSGAV